eukprot:2347279-Rhodomonas_salina.2
MGGEVGGETGLVGLLLRADVDEVAVAAVRLEHWTPHRLVVRPRQRTQIVYLPAARPFQREPNRTSRCASNIECHLGEHPVR